jgi:hypothetical protein
MRCGSQFGEYPQFEGEECHLKRASLDKFSAYLTEQLKRVQRIDLYACWDGDQTALPVGKRQLDPDALGSHKFYFHEKEYLQFELAPAAVLTDPTEDG